jgi:hypothetical protein
MVHLHLVPGGRAPSGGLPSDGVHSGGAPGSRPAGPSPAAGSDGRCARCEQAELLAAETVTLCSYCGWLDDLGGCEACGCLPRSSAPLARWLRLSVGARTVQVCSAKCAVVVVDALEMSGLLLADPDRVAELSPPGSGL